MSNKIYSILWVGSNQQLPQKLHSQLGKHKDFDELKVLQIQNLLTIRSSPVDLLANEIHLVLFQFEDWNLDIKSIFYLLKKVNPHIKMIAIFESKQNQLENQSIILDFFDASIVLNEEKDSFFFKLNKLLEREIEKEEEFMTIDNLVYPFLVKIPLRIKEIDEKSIHLMKFTDSQYLHEMKMYYEIKNEKLFIGHTEVEPNCQIMVTEKQFLLQANFEQELEKIKSFNSDFFKKYKVKIFCQKSELNTDFANLLNDQKIEVDFHFNTHDKIENADIFIIEDFEVNGEKMSELLIPKILKVKESIIIIFSTNSSSAAYQKAFNYPKILSCKDPLSVSRVLDFVKTLKKKYQLDDQDSFQPDSYKNGVYSLQTNLLSLNENIFSLEFPFELSKGQLIEVNFGFSIMGIVIKTELNDKKKFKTEILNLSADEKDLAIIRKSINNFIYCQNKEIQIHELSDLNELDYLIRKNEEMTLKLLLEEETKNFQEKNKPASAS